MMSPLVVCRAIALMVETVQLVNCEGSMFVCVACKCLFIEFAEYLAKEAANVDNHAQNVTSKQCLRVVVMPCQ